MFPADLFRMWFADLDCVEADDSTLVLSAPTDFTAMWIENNYLDLIARQAEGLAGGPVSVRVRSGAETEASSRAEAPRAAPERGVAESPERSAPADGGGARERNHACSCLNPRNTFDNFVIGGGNQLAHAASIAVAKSPGRAYNPLFVYGDTGLGKTHLMHAVAHQMLASKPDARIAYISTEKFTNEYINAIRENKLTKFRKYYRTADALLVDDIHFLSGKESTQEEFFHTFNDLFESGRQIFLACDRPANEIERLQHRLVSRFQWGLVTDIQAPDFETRVAILRKKTQSLNLSVPEDILTFLAERVSRNVRRMEGALTRIGSYSALINQDLDVGAVERLLSDLLQEEAEGHVTIEQIQKKVADYYHIRLNDLLGRRRTNTIAFPRQVAMYISRTLTSEPLKGIGDAFGGRDHGTVIHACRQVEHAMEQEGAVKRAVDYLINALSNPRS